MSISSLAEQSVAGDVELEFHGTDTDTDTDTDIRDAPVIQLGGLGERYKLRN